MKHLTTVKTALLAATIAVGVAGAASAATTTAADQAPPLVSISTGHGAQLVPDPARPARTEATRILTRTGAPVRPSYPESQVTGRVSDDRSGVARVEVVFRQCVTADSTDRSYTCSGMMPRTALQDAGEVTLTCSDASRTSCLWSAGLPLAPGHYLVMASAVDRAGHVGPPTRPVHIVVL